MVREAYLSKLLKYKMSKLLRDSKVAVTHRDGKYIVYLGINHPSIIRASLRITR